ncbi:MAG: PAS domain-containing sensor histidine kinase, partial [Chitinophagaceae bacterium]
EIIEQGFDKILSDVYKTGIPFHAYEAPVSLVRNGKLEVLYYTYVYQAQRNINGEIEGVAVIASEVTPQATLNLKIRESEGRFRQLVQQAPVAICVIRGEKYVVETVNAGMLEFWGRTEAQVLHKPIFEVLTELEGQGFEALVNGVYTTGQKFVGTELPVTLLRRGQLENAYVTFVYEPLREVDGTISGIMVLAHEITDLVVARKRIEAQVIMHEEMLMNAPYVACTLEGPNHVYTLVNKKYQQLFGNRILKGKPFLEAIPEMEGQGFDTLLDTIYNTGETYIGYDIPSTFAREEGQTPELRYFNFSYQPMFDENRKIYSILGFGYEVTEVVKAKLIIEESELKFRVLTNSMPQKITNADKDGNVIFFNQQWLDDTGLTFEELRDWGWEKAMHPDDLEPTVNNWKHSVATGDVFDMECRIQNKEGDYRWHLSRAVPVRDKNGKIVMWVGSNTDIHEQKEQKEGLQHAVAVRTLELSEANEELKKMNKELEAFTYVSSHDLQEPLRKIRIMAERILEKENQNLSDNGKNYFRLMQNAAERMQTLIQDLLTFSRLSTADRKFVTTDLNKIIEEVKKEFKEAIAEKHATIEVKEICEVKIIPFQFRQLMHNLIDNALKFSNPNIPPHIIIESKNIRFSSLNIANLPPKKEYCHITISDNGIGFEKEFAEKIFEVFQKLHDKDEYAGTGIGLAIVKKIIENHHGFITATSELKKGTTFNIYIPA